MARPSNLDDPIHAAYAWRRFRNVLGGMSVAGALAVGVALFILHGRHAALPFHYFLAAGLGMFFTVVLTAALMGLVFLSSGTGHDEAIEDPLTEHLEYYDD